MSNKIRSFQYDYVVVGGGLSGLQTAYYLSKSGSVALLSLASLEDSNSYFAQGGMAAVTNSADSPEEHLEDTLVAGAGLCDREAVRILTEEAPKRIEELIGLGMKFDTKDGHLALGLEGGHHHHRILHAGGDATGRQVTLFMIEQVRKQTNIKVFQQHTLVELIIVENKCCGVWAEYGETGQLEAFFARAVVLATGGAAALYRPTTNPPSALGDGLAIAYRAGAKIRDMEFVQFHPTALHYEGAPSFLISEAVRGEGAYLLNPAGERFMVGRHPMAELAPRDIVAREIYSEMKHFDTEYVILSLKHLDPQHILNRFPTISRELECYGLDLTQEIPVAPASHYTIGGIYVDLNGKTSIEGLFAVGEVSSTGVMGANRLASNSLVECIVYAKRIADYIEKNPQGMLCEATQSELKPTIDIDFDFDDEAWRAEKEKKLMKRLGKLLMKKAGIIKKHKKLKKTLEEINDVLAELEDFADLSVAVRQVYNRYLVGSLIVLSALDREESRGAHYRKDFPETLPPGEAYHTVIQDNIIKNIKHVEYKRL